MELKLEFSLDQFKKNGISFRNTFGMKPSLDYFRLYELEGQFNKGIGLKIALGRLKERTPSDYYNEIEASQTEARTFANHVFPAYRLLLPEVLMDDWLSIMGPHQKNRRDHSLHQPLTAFIVSELLGGGDPEKALDVNGKSLLSLCAEILCKDKRTTYLRDFFENLYPYGLPRNVFARKTWAEAIFYQTAITAALYHDIGYPWQFVNKVKGNIDIINRIGANTVYKGSTGVSEQIRDRLLQYPFHEYSDIPQYASTAVWDKEVERLVDKAYRETHGFPGALAFTWLNDYVRKFSGSPDLKQANIRFVQEWASVGIMMHDMVWQYYGKNKTPDNPRYKLSMSTDPLSCLIAMADVLEEFSRPKAKYSVNKLDIVTSFNPSCNSTTVKVRGRKLFIIYKYPSRGEAVRQREDRMKEINSYFNPTNGYIDLSTIGIDKVVCKVK